MRSNVAVADQWIQTFTGRQFFPLAPRIEDIDIWDIAHALANQCRFSGHTQQHFSVAQHSVYVSALCAAPHRLQGLLHDASEAYMVDLPSPIKHAPALAGYREAEGRLQRMIFERYGCSVIEHASVKEADRIMLSTEARDLMGPLHPEWNTRGWPAPLSLIIDPWPADEACVAFVETFRELHRGK